MFLWLSVSEQHNEVIRVFKCIATRILLDEIIIILKMLNKRGNDENHHQLCADSRKSAKAKARVSCVSELLHNINRNPQDVLLCVEQHDTIYY